MINPFLGPPPSNAFSKQIIKKAPEPLQYIKKMINLMILRKKGLHLSFFKKKNMLIYPIDTRSPDRNRTRDETDKEDDQDRKREYNKKGF